LGGSCIGALRQGIPPQTRDINAEVIKTRTGKTIKEYMADCIPVVEAVKDNEILRGLAELLSGEEEKAWVKTHLRKEVVFLLKNYQLVLK